MRILFAGSPAFVFPVVKFLAENSGLVGILTNAPAPTGRGKKLSPSPLLKCIQNCMQENTDDSSEKSQVLSRLSRLQIIEAEKINDSVKAEARALNCDLLVCYAFGKIFSESFLSCFRYGGINIHPSLLPRWRGASPVPAAILNGDKITGVSIQTIVNKMDAGDILASAEYPLNDTENADEVLEALTQKSISLLKNIFIDFETSLKDARSQDESKATYCTKRSSEKINWDKSAVQIMRTVLALTPKPRAFSSVADERINLTKVSVCDSELGSDVEKVIAKNYKNGKILKADKKYGILVKTGDGILAIERLQRQGKKEMHWKDFLNGYKNFLELEFDN